MSRIFFSIGQQKSIKPKNTHCLLEPHTFAVPTTQKSGEPLLARQVRALPSPFLFLKTKRGGDRKKEKPFFNRRPLRRCSSQIFIRTTVTYCWWNTYTYVHRANRSWLTRTGKNSWPTATTRSAVSRFTAANVCHLNREPLAIPSSLVPLEFFRNLRRFLQKSFCLILAHVLMACFKSSSQDVRICPVRSNERGKIQQTPHKLFITKSVSQLSIWGRLQRKNAAMVGRDGSGIQLCARVTAVSAVILRRQSAWWVKTRR